MSFLPFHPGIYSPDELRIVQDVYSSIAAEPWFVKDEEKRHAFAAKVLVMYERGMTIPGKLLGICTLMARRHFSEDPQPNSGGQKELPR